MIFEIEYDEERIKTLEESFDEIVFCIPKNKRFDLIGNLNDMYLLISSVKKGKVNVSKNQKQLSS